MWHTPEVSHERKWKINVSLCDAGALHPPGQDCLVNINWGCAFWVKGGDSRRFSGSQKVPFTVLTPRAPNCKQNVCRQAGLCNETVKGSTKIIHPKMQLVHDDVIKWKHFPRYWPFVWGIHRSPVNSPAQNQWHGALMLSLICAWINGWANNGEAGNMRRHRDHYDVIVILRLR